MHTQSTSELDGEVPEGWDRKIGETDKMITKQMGASFVFDMENYEAVTEQLNSPKHKTFIRKTFTMVQKNKKGNNEVSEENIQKWAKRVFK